MTTEAVKFKAMGMETEDHMGSTLAGLEDGTEPASCPEAFLIHTPELLTIFEPSTETNAERTMV